MYLHLGSGVILKEKSIVGIFDLDKTTVTKEGRLYLSNKEKRGKIVSVKNKIPKSFVLYMENREERIYISQMSTSTLLKRSILENKKSINI